VPAEPARKPIWTVSPPRRGVSGEWHGVQGQRHRLGLGPGNEDVDPETVERPVIPAGRPGHPNEVAAMIAFLAGPESRYTTGSSFVIDGGLTLVAADANAESS